MTPMERCPNCLAPLRLDVGPVVQCAYCGAQTRLATSAVEKPAAASGVRLAEAVSFKTPTKTIPFLDANAGLPIFRTETLSTQTDNQETLHVNLVQGATEVASLRFPIHQRGPRGVPKITLTVRVSATGALSLTVAEPGTQNIVDHVGQNVRVVG
jgi:molecular chaperone DnaK (HSP70)